MVVVRLIHVRQRPIPFNRLQNDKKKNGHTVISYYKVAPLLTLKTDTQNNLLHFIQTVSCQCQLDISMPTLKKK